MLIFRIAQAWLLITLSPLSSSDVMLTRNKASLKRLARNFLPQLVEMVSEAEQASEGPVAAEEAPGDAGKPPVDSGERIVPGEDFAASTEEPPRENVVLGDQEARPKAEYDDQLLEEVEADAKNEEYVAADPEDEAAEGHNAETTPGVEVDLDELVEKVRERLLDEFKGQPSDQGQPRSNQNQVSQQQQQQQQQRIDPDNKQGNEDYEVAIDDAQPYSKKKQQQPQQQQQQPTDPDNKQGNADYEVAIDDPQPYSKKKQQQQQQQPADPYNKQGNEDYAVAINDPQPYSKKKQLNARPNERQPTDQDKKYQGNADYAVAVDKPQAALSKQKQLNVGPDEKPKLRLNTQLKKKLKPARSELKQPLKPKQKGKSGAVVESHDFYQKIKLSKKINSKKRDSYEDYLAAVKPTGNVFDRFDMEEEDPNEAKILEEKTAGPIRTVQTTENVGDRIQYQKSKSMRKVTRKTRPSAMSNVMSKNNNMNQPNRNLRTTPHADNDGNAADRVVTNEFVMQEFIGDWNDETPAGYQKPTEEAVQYPRKKPTKKIQTNMPIRQRYTIPCTPNYYDKLPRIAEKYNFDEPLPEKDREEETIRPELKKLHKSPQNINGKIKIRTAQGAIRYENPGRSQLSSLKYH